jgi:mRNA interferase YafQ
MRTTIDRLSSFKHDYRREFKTYGAGLDDLLVEVLTSLLADADLPERRRDHKLVGKWEGYRECHIKPDLFLIYEKPDEETLKLVRLGAHAELFGM